MRISSFTRLEDKVGTLIELTRQLKRENQQLREQLAEKQREVQAMGEQVAARNAERIEVKQRIRSLVSRLEGM